MILDHRIASFEVLGDLLRSFPEALPGKESERNLIAAAAAAAEAGNPWFTTPQVSRSLNAIGESLRKEKLNKWLEPYLKKLQSCQRSGTVGLVTAGNIPAVGFHDLLCALISGHRVLARLSSSDRDLLPAILSLLSSINHGWDGQVTWHEDLLTGFDCIIATGSNNSGRFFEYYFSNVPHIIRRNRNSLAVLSGRENVSELEGLADDALSYFGLGCRNVSKIFVPENYDFSPLIHALSSGSGPMTHSGYRNNYLYRKTLLLLDQNKIIDTGNLILVRSEKMASPVAVLHYDFYSDIREVEEYCLRMEASIQCVVSSIPLSCRTIVPGRAQAPELWDYADNIDTMEFLAGNFLPGSVWKSNIIP